MYTFFYIYSEDLAGDFVIADVNVYNYRTTKDAL